MEICLIIFTEAKIKTIANLFRFQMFRMSDVNSDGKIDWDEFLQMMLPGHQEVNFLKLTEHNKSK